jgi:hypothetical protein
MLMAGWNVLLLAITRHEERTKSGFVVQQKEKHHSVFLPKISQHIHVPSLVM